jgi:hypothetical protein
MDYGMNTQSCAPSCYKAEPREDAAQGIKGCGYHLYQGREEKIGDDKWSKLQAGPYAFADDGAVPQPCDQFPAPGAEWKAEVATARAQITTLKANDVVIAAPGQTDWSYEKNELGVVVARLMDLRVYQHDVKTKANPCAGGKDPLTFCEKGKSRVAIAANAAAYHLAEAATLQKAGKKNACRQAAWEAAEYAAGGEQVRELGKANSQWIPGAKYELRDGRVLDEDAVFKALDEDGSQAATLFQSCGGSGAPPLFDNNVQAIDHVLETQPIRGIDGVVRNPA